MIKKYFFSLYLAVIVLVGVSFFITSTLAEALTVSPVRIELSLDPGQAYQGEYTLVNDSDAQRVYYNSFENFESQGETGVPVFVASNTGLASWLEGPALITLDPGERKTISYTLRVPADADAGGYFSVIFWSNNPPEADAVSNVAAKIGILMLLRVNGEIEESGGLLEFVTDSKKSFYTALPIPLQYRFANDGGDRLQPRGVVEVKNMLGREVVFDANPTLGNVLPNTIRRYELAWGEGESEPGFWGALRSQWGDFHVGPYRLKLDVVYASDQQRTDEVLKLFVFPWQLLVTILMLGSVLFLGGRAFLLRYNRWIIAAATAAGTEKKVRPKKKK
jgi:hypothetical protein